MSITVIVIMLLHGLPVYFVGIISQNKSSMLIAALVSTVLGFLIGNPAYFGADLLAIVIGYRLAEPRIKVQPRPYNNPYVGPDDN